MNPTKEEIKEWLKALGHSREWLGERCGGVSKRAVDNWLSSPREIPGRVLAIIARLIAEDQQDGGGREDLSHVTLRITTDELNEWSRAFKRSDAETLEEWAIKAIRAARVEDLGSTGQAEAEGASGEAATNFADPAEMARAVQRQHAERMDSEKTQQSRAE